MTMELILADRGQGARCPCPTDFPGVTIAEPAGPAEWAGAHRLVLELFEWIEGASGLEVAEIQAEAVHELAAMQETYRWPRGRFHIARHQGDIVGSTAVLMIRPDLAELKRVWVTPEARGHQIGSALLHSALESARSLGAATIRLETMPSIMARAVELYFAHGFRPIPPYSALSEREDILAMELRLAA